MMHIVFSSILLVSFCGCAEQIDMNTKAPKFDKNKIFVTVLLLTYLSSEPIAISYA